jgi:hypothetical protein
VKAPCGPVAQFGLERTPDKREVDGSIPSRPTIWLRELFIVPDFKQLELGV